jgi:hypothetical protein
MVIDRNSELRAIRSFPALIRYLGEEMDWPIPSFIFDDLTFEYSAEELGIDEDNAAKIQDIRRLRPLSVDQPWGIFFVSFEPKRLPVVALRRILSQVTLRKRISANSSERQMWEANDLLFISNYGEGVERQISFAHFADPPEGQQLPTLRVLGWDDMDTALHLDDVARELHDNLSWPSDETDVDKWRADWRSAFKVEHREEIKTSRSLSIHLARVARSIRDRVNTAIDIESESGQIRKLMNAFREALLQDITADEFSDMCAQTITYGLLSARITNPEVKSTRSLATQMRTNPFLKELMEMFLDPSESPDGSGSIRLDFDELGVSELVTLLNEANMEAVVRDFGNRNPAEDPVIHFYENFLNAYDSSIRFQRGVFYTPRPVVSFLVNSIHQTLIDEFGLEDGLADTTTWGQLALRMSINLPDEVSASDPFVSILDPAVGTGTFLIETIDVIYRTLRSRWELESNSESEIKKLWNQYVPRNLLPRIHGFELLMAPYAMAHLKIGLKLLETEYEFIGDERARVFLTNALEPENDVQLRLGVLPALAEEARLVNEVKKSTHFTVVLGNPPYSVSSWNTGEWINTLAEEYKRTVRKTESQIQSLSNDYIKFLRLAEWHIERSGIGVIGMITGHGYLQGTQPRDMRQHLARTFDRVYCLDLNGSIRRDNTTNPDDEPIFQITTGVATFLGVKSSSDTALATTSQGSLSGPLATKNKILLSEDAVSANEQVVVHDPSEPYYHFTSGGVENHVAAEFSRFADLTSIFGTGDRQKDKEKRWATGFASQQDDIAISFTVSELEEKMNDLANATSFEQLRSSYRLCSTNQWDFHKARDFAISGEWKRYVRKVDYRPFDERWTVAHKHVLTILRNRVMEQLDAEEEDGQIGLISSRAVNDASFAHTFVASGRTDKIFLSSKSSTNAYVFPLFIRSTGSMKLEKVANLNPEFIKLLESHLFPDRDGITGLEEIDPIKIFGYIYSVLHSQGYRTRYNVPLKVDFPRIPVPNDHGFFSQLSDLGAELIDVHLLKLPPSDNVAVYKGPPNPMVGRVGWSDNTVWLDAPKVAAKQGYLAAQPGNIGFENVPEEVWKLKIGGYQVTHKWLKDRAGRSLSTEESNHYAEIVSALQNSIRISNEIDDVIEEHGGWPGAFANQTDTSISK